MMWRCTCFPRAARRPGTTRCSPTATSPACVRASTPATRPPATTSRACRDLAPPACGDRAGDDPARGGAVDPAAAVADRGGGPGSRASRPLAAPAHPLADGRLGHRRVRAPGDPLRLVARLGPRPPHPHAVLARRALRPRAGTDVRRVPRGPARPHAPHRDRRTEPGRTPRTAADRGLTPCGSGRLVHPDPRAHALVPPRAARRAQ